MFKRNLLFTVLGIAACWSSTSFAQFNSNNVELLSHIDLATFGASRGNDSWGYVAPSGREYALMGLNNKVAFVEITDPANADWFASVSHTSSTWCDIKVYRDHAYIVTEATTGIQIVDMSDIDNHTVTLVRTITSPGRSHNVALDETSGFLYTCGSRNGSATTVILDLSNPANPVEVGRWSGAYEHDAQIVTFESGPNTGRQIFYGASTRSGLDIIDVTNKSNVFLVSRTPYPNVSYCHQVWTADGQYLYINDELDSIPRTIVFDISNINDPVHLGDFSSGLAAIDHNNYVKDGFLFSANYHSGLRIFDLNADPVNPPQVGFFDTYPADDSGGFDGAWSNYPFFPSGTVIVSDINRGLFVLDPSEAVGSTPATLADITIIDGFTVSGGVPELEASDDTYFSTLALETGKASETHRLLYQVRADTTVQNPSTIDITLEGHIFDIEAIVTLFLRDVNTGLFEEVGQFTQVFGTDTSNTVNVPNAARFVRPSGRIVLRVKKVIILPITIGEGFPSLDDLLEIGVR